MFTNDTQEIPLSSLNISDLYILLIEPSNTQRKYIIHHLEDAGIGVIKGVVTGAEAIASMQKDLPDFLKHKLQLEKQVINWYEKNLGKLKAPIPHIFEEKAKEIVEMITPYMEEIS